MDTLLGVKIYISRGNNNSFRIINLFSERKYRAFVYQLRGDRPHRKRDKEREKKKPACSSFIIAKLFGFLEPSCSFEIFNFHSSGQIKPGRYGYHFSPARKLRKILGRL
jgi:hypothetical protein